MSGIKHETSIVLGIPIDNLTFIEAVENIFTMVEEFSQDSVPKYVATVNVDFIVNTLSWMPYQTRHPELLEILRKADMVTADGMPVVWAARLLGTRFKERVTGADLVPALAQEAAKRGKSIYLLGGRGDVAKRAGDILKKASPELVIAGIKAPFVHVEGDFVENTEDEDTAIINDINRVKPDILFIGFGNPKQEIWFERNRNRINAAVSIGIGGTYEFITGRVKRAPEWIQKTGFEWIYRIYQDPLRLFKRYFVGFFKFGTMILPSVLYLKYRTWLLNISWGKNTEKDTFKIDSDLFFNVVRLEQRIDSEWVNSKGGEVLSIAAGKNTVLDFSDVNFIDSTGIGFLMKAYRQCHRENESRLILCGVKAPVMRTFQLIRVSDVFEKISVNTVEDALARFTDSVADKYFYYFSDIDDGVVTLQLFGSLDGGQVEQNKTALESVINSNKHFIINLKEVAYIDNRALVFLLNLQKKVKQKGKIFIICVDKGNVRQMLKISKLEHLFSIVTDPAAAKNMIEVKF